MTQTGASTHFHNNTITIASPYLGSGVHVNESIWTYSGSPCNLWVETGYTRGYRAYTGYTYYIGWNDSVNGYNDQQSTTTTPDGSDHIYSLLWTGGTTYQTIRDGIVLRTSSGYGSGSCISQAGLEVSGNTPLSAYHADTFNDTPLQYRNTAGSFISGGWTSSWIDFPCGAGYSTPNCLNGTFYGNNQWANNKP